MAPVLKSFSDLVDYLRAERVPHEPTAASKSVHIPTEDGGVQIIRWQDEDGLIQFIQSMLRNLPAERMPALESAVARLNHALAWVGLDLNHEHGLLSFRLAVPLMPGGTIEASAIPSGFRVAVRAAARLMPILTRVAAGELTADAVVAETRRTVFAPDPPPQLFDTD